jgi:hypothetical protein
MNPYLKMFLIILLTSMNSLMAHSMDNPSGGSPVKIYPVTPGGKISDDYKLYVNGIPVPIEKIEKFSEAPVQYALMDYDGSVKLNFLLTTKAAIRHYSISPISQKINSNCIGNTVRFSINKPQYVVLRITGMNDLFILIDHRDARAPMQGDINVKNIQEFGGIDPTGHQPSTAAINRAIEEASLSKDHRVLYFPPGTYLSAEIRMKDNVSLYLAGGALVQATGNKADFPDNALIYWDHVTNAKISGRGVVDGNGRVLTNSSGIHIISAIFSKDCLVEGITEKDSPFWANHIFKSQFFNYENIKVINYRRNTMANNTDGLNFDCSKYCSLHNGFFYTGDDNCVVKGTQNDASYNVQHIVFDKYIGYSNSAACKIGTETLVDSINHISFKNVDIIRCDRGLVIDAYDNSSINNISFENINVENIAPNGEGSDSSRFIHFLITRTGWRQSAGEATINNVLVKNVTAHFTLSSFGSQIVGISPRYHISNLVFQNLKAMDSVNHPGVQLKPKRDDIMTNSFVYHVKFIK